MEFEPVDVFSTWSLESTLRTVATPVECFESTYELVAHPSQDERTCICYQMDISPSNATYSKSFELPLLQKDWMSVLFKST